MTNGSINPSSPTSGSAWERAGDGRGWRRRRRGGGRGGDGTAAASRGQGKRSQHRACGQRPPPLEHAHGCAWEGSARSRRRRRATRLRTEARKGCLAAPVECLGLQGGSAAAPASSAELRPWWLWGGKTLDALPHSWLRKEGQERGNGEEWLALARPLGGALYRPEGRGS